MLLLKHYDAYLIDPDTNSGEISYRHVLPQHKEAVMHVPIENLLIETDSPVFYGSEETGFCAGPKDVFRSLKLYSKLKHINEEKAAEIFYRNSQNFFGIDDGIR